MIYVYLVVVVGGVETVENLWKVVGVQFDRLSFQHRQCWKLVEKLKTFANVEMLNQCWKIVEKNVENFQLFNKLSTSFQQFQQCVEKCNVESCGNVEKCVESSNLRG